MGWIYKAPAEHYCALPSLGFGRKTKVHSDSLWECEVCSTQWLVVDMGGHLFWEIYGVDLRENGRGK